MALYSLSSVNKREVFMSMVSLHLLANKNHTPTQIQIMDDLTVCDIYSRVLVLLVREIFLRQIDASIGCDADVSVVTSQQTDHKVLPIFRSECRLLPIEKF